MLGAAVSSGAQFYGRMHASLAAAFHGQCLATLEGLRRELRSYARLHPGHGEPAGAAWPRLYLPVRKPPANGK